MYDSAYYSIPGLILGIANLAITTMPEQIEDLLNYIKATTHKGA